MNPEEITGMIDWAHALTDDRLIFELETLAVNVSARASQQRAAVLLEAASRLKNKS